MVRNRPGTLAEAVARVTTGENDFGFAISEFLDTFYLDKNPARQLIRLRETPPDLPDPRQNAYVGAIAEHLCDRWRIGRPPEWVNAPERFLDSPYFVGGPKMHPILLMESPVAFRRRFIFTEAEPLRRIRMPQDGRWWAYETLRSGITPTDPSEIVESRPRKI